MKNLTLLVVALLLTGQTYAQSGLELTAGYTPGISFILNDDDFAAGQDLNYQVTYGSNLGITAGFNFSERIGLLTGFGVASINQNFITDIPGLSKKQQGTFNRKITYIRIPFMIRIGGDPTAPTSAFFRFGPHLDFLASAVGNYELASLKQTLNFRKYKSAEVYKAATIGLTMEVGGRIRITDVMGVLLLFHLETSLTNPEGEDAWAVPGFKSSLGERAPSWNVMPGINISFQYTLNFN